MRTDLVVGAYKEAEVDPEADPLSVSTLEHEKLLPSNWGLTSGRGRRPNCARAPQEGPGTPYFFLTLSFLVSLFELPPAGV